MNDITTIINNVLTMIVWPVFLGLSVIMFIIAGILFLTAQGDPSKISKAKQAVIWGVVGIAVALVGFSAKNIITSILGL